MSPSVSARPAIRTLIGKGISVNITLLFSVETYRRVAEAYIRQLNDAHVFKKPIATRVDPLRGFFKAEDYHQDYLVRHPEQPYIATYDIPKVAMLREVFPDRYTAKPTTVF